jgi:hypothetical protein
MLNMCCQEDHGRLTMIGQPSYLAQK